MTYDDDELERHIGMVKMRYEGKGPGKEINLKAKRRWEVLRRTDNYRRDWDNAFAQMVRMLKEFPGIEADDLGCEPEKKKMEKAISELRKDPATWEDFLEKKFQRDWPPGKLKQEFLYSRHVVEGRNLADKYGLITPYHYDDPLWNPLKERMRYVFKDQLPIFIITQNPSSYKIGPNREVIVDHTPHLRDGRFLTIEIDLYEKQGMIQKLIKEQLDFYQNILKRPKLKKRERALDFYLDTEKGKVSIYELWDMNTKDGKSPWQITKELYPSDTKDKSYQLDRKNGDKDVRRIWKQIDEGIKIAHNEINPLL